MAKANITSGAGDPISYDTRSGETLSAYLGRLGYPTNGVNVKVNGMTVVLTTYKVKNGDNISLVKNLEGNLV
jgi:sulfur carrier protein ThiS